MDKIGITRGYLSFTGPSIDNIAASSCKNCDKINIPYHITIFTKNELQDAKSKGIYDAILQDAASLSFDIINLGVGKSGNVEFNVILYPDAAQLRQKYNYPKKDFHITLVNTDNHDIDKSVKSLIRPNKTLMSDKAVDSIWKCPIYSNDPDVLTCVFQETNSEKVFHKLSYILTDDLHSQQVFFMDVAESHPDWVSPFLRLGETFLKSKHHKKAMISFLIAYANAKKKNLGNENIKIQTHIVSRLVQCSHYTEWGPILFETIDDNEMKDSSNWAFEWLIEKYNDYCPFPEIILPENHVPTLSLQSRTRPVVKDSHDYIMPRFFRWIIPFQLAAMSTPRNQKDVEYLSKSPFNIECIVTLTEEEPLPKEWFSSTNVENVFLPAPNYKPPTHAQISTFFDIVVTKKKRTLVHCGGGKGRAGTYLACMISACGFTTTIKDLPVFSAKESIDIIRKIRPGSIETLDQEKFITDFVSKMWKSEGDVFGSKISEPINTDFIKSGTFSGFPSLIILVGLQGSGKSYFSEMLKKCNYVIISQDQLGSKAAVFETLAKHVKKKDKIVIDRCNVDVNSRKEILEAAFYPKDALCIHFNYKVELCIQRANTRTDHPTIKQGKAATPTKSMAKILIPPTLKEGFSCVITVSSFNNVQELLKKFNIQNETKPEKFYKFPRTRHLFNLGSASRDDLILSEKQVSEFLTCGKNEKITIQEKIDGANLGISIEPISCKFMVQNRSHYVNSKSHAQFKSLDKWLTDHTADLWKLLEPGKNILYGEWLAARHSIHYTGLPDTFIAFDLYDISTNTFYSTSKLQALLAETSIKFITNLPLAHSLTKEYFLKLIEHQSEFYDGKLEGVYVRKENETVLCDRAKIVRPDFICGNDHWSKGMITFNKIIQTPNQE